MSKDKRESRTITFEAITPLERKKRIRLAIARVIDFFNSEFFGFNSLKGDLSREDLLAEKYAKKLSKYDGDPKARFGKNVYGRAILLYNQTLRTPI